MKNTLLCSFVFASLCLGCSHSELESKAGEASTKSIKVIDPELQKWVGQYHGITPCITCSTFCDGCEGTTIELNLLQDQTFKLVRTGNSGKKKSEAFEGKFSFEADGKIKIQLNGVTERNIIVWGQDYIEILDTKSGLPFEAYEDFQLEKLI